MIGPASRMRLCIAFVVKGGIDILGYCDVVGGVNLR